jgi:hypothetical protein
LPSLKLGEGTGNRDPRPPRLSSGQSASPHCPPSPLSPPPHCPTLVQLSQSLPARPTAGTSHLQNALPARGLWPCGAGGTPQASLDDCELPESAWWVVAPCMCVSNCFRARDGHFNQLVRVDFGTPIGSADPLGLTLLHLCSHPCLPHPHHAAQPRSATPCQSPSREDPTRAQWCCGATVWRSACAWSTTSG